MAGNAHRRNSFRRMTEKERSKQMRNLTGFETIHPHFRHSLKSQYCEKCVKNRDRIRQLEREFNELREQLLSKKRIFDSNVTEKREEKSKRGTPSDGKLALVQESAKLRITLDALMRFQLFEALQNEQN